MKWTRNSIDQSFGRKGAENKNTEKGKDKGPTLRTISDYVSPKKI
jgi:hypothetical protein